MPRTNEKKRKTRGASHPSNRDSQRSHERPIDPLDIDTGGQATSDVAHAGERSVDRTDTPTTDTPPAPPRTRRIQPDVDRDVGKRAEAADRVRERAAATPHKGGPGHRGATPKKPNQR